MSFEVAAIKLLSRKEARDGIQKLLKKGTEKIYVKPNREVENKTENLYPGLKRDKLPDFLSHLETRIPSQKEISAERQGAKLTTDVAQRLWDAGVTPKSWENADFKRREQLLFQAKQIMGQEMLLSPSIRQTLKIRVMDNLNGESRLSGDLLKDKEHFNVNNPRIYLNSELLKRDDCIGALEALYREMMYTIKIDELSGLKASSKEAQNISEFLDKKFHDSSDNMKNPIENEAFGQSHVFKLAYQIEGQKHPEEVATKSKEVIIEKEFATSTELHAEKIKDVFLHSPELQFEQWKKMDLNQRITTLQNFENKIAEIEQRNPVPLFAENLSKGVNGYYTNTVQGTNKIALSSKLLSSNDYNDYKKALKTLFHEGRHAYQDYNIRVTRTESSDDLIKQWKINREYFGYQVGDATLTGYYRYYIQPVEADANLFADATVRKIGL